MQTVTLIRHAEAETNPTNAHIIAGQSNWAELTPYGIVQASALRFRLAKSAFTKVYSSPAVRCQQTARYALPFHRVILVPEFLELYQGEWEGKLREEVMPQEVRAYINRNPWQFKAPGGESQEEVYQRASLGLESVLAQLNEGESAAVISHANTIKFLLAGLLHLEKSTAYQIPIGNTSVTVLEYEQGHWHEQARNDISHLSEHGLASLRSVYDKD